MKQELFAPVNRAKHARVLAQRDVFAESFARELDHWPSVYFQAFKQRNILSIMKAI